MPSISYYTSLLELLKSSLEELKVKQILKSYSFEYVLNNNYTTQEQEVNVASQETVAEGVLQKFAAFSKQQLGLSRPNVNGRFSEWEVLPEETGHGVNISLDVNSHAIEHLNISTMQQTEDMLAGTDENFDIPVHLSLAESEDLEDREDDFHSDNTFTRKVMRNPPPLSCGKNEDGPEGNEDFVDGAPDGSTTACCEVQVREQAVSPILARFICSVCGKGFNYKASMDNHILKHTGEFKFSCEICEKLFASQWKLNAHMHTHREPRYECSVCLKKFVRRSSCNEHEMTHNMGNTYSCSLCELKFKSPKYLKRHEQRHGKQADQKCSFCGTLFKSKDALKIHINRHQSASTLYCSEVGCKSTRAFLTRGDLDRHLRAHKEKFLCAACGKEFKYKHHLMDHEQNAHFLPLNQTAMTYKCQLCTKSFKQKRRLDEHVKCHLQQPDFTCSICGKTFFRRDTLTNHFYLHSEQRLFTCAQCGKGFSSKSNLSSHVKKHDDTDRIKCHMCSATFKLKSSYDFHMQGHAGNFSYECSVCKKKFVRRCHFNDHMRTHDSSRPHVCPTCGKSYKEIKHCRAHINRAHPNEFNLETLVASITPEDARVAEILCSESGQDMADIANILPSSTESPNKEITFL